MCLQNQQWYWRAIVHNRYFWFFGKKIQKITSKNRNVSVCKKKSNQLKLKVYSYGFQDTVKFNVVAVLSLPPTQQPELEKVKHGKKAISYNFVYLSKFGRHHKFGCLPAKHRKMGSIIKKIKTATNTYEFTTIYEKHNQHLTIHVLIGISLLRYQIGVSQLSSSRCKK